MILSFIKNFKQDVPRKGFDSQESRQDIMIKTKKSQKMYKTGHCSCKFADTQEDMSPCSAWPMMMVTDTRVWAEEGDGDPDEMLSLLSLASPLGRDPGHNGDSLR